MSKARILKKQQSDMYEPARRARAVHTIELARSYLSNPKVTRSLGAIAHELLAVTELLEVPIIRSGRVRMAPGYRDSDAVPFVVMHRGEELVNPMVEHGPTQRQTMGRLAAEFGSHDHAGSYSRPQTHVIDSTEVGATWGVPIEWEGHDGLVHASMRPFVGVIGRDARHMALTTVHEAAHVADFLNRPIGDQSVDDMRLSTELKAYSVAHVVETLTSPDGSINNTLAAQIAALRERHNGSIKSEDAFASTDSIRQAMEHHNLEYTWRK